MGHVAMIIIVPYDPAWPAMFDTEAANIRGVLGERALRIEHVGSTSVPGLAAKPVVDIQVSVPSLEPLSHYLEPLGQIGYRHVSLGPFDWVYPFFQKPGEWPSTHHIHLCVIGSEQEGKHLAFRDYLRKNPSIAAEYVALKSELAAENHGNTFESREQYSLAKSEFVNGVLRRTLSEGGPSLGENGM
jgi:GrpB-like predicted nucleotidyltransferase (UPF0157 family)